MNAIAASKDSGRIERDMFEVYLNSSLFSPGTFVHLKDVDRPCRKRNDREKPVRGIIDVCYTCISFKEGSSVIDESTAAN